MPGDYDGLHFSHLRPGSAPAKAMEGGARSRLVPALRADLAAASVLRSAPEGTGRRGSAARAPRLLRGAVAPKCPPGARAPRRRGVRARHRQWLGLRPVGGQRGSHGPGGDPRPGRGRAAARGGAPLPRPRGGQPAGPSLRLRRHGAAAHGGSRRPSWRCPAPRRAPRPAWWGARVCGSAADDVVEAAGALLDAGLPPAAPVPRWEPVFAAASAGIGVDVRADRLVSRDGERGPVQADLAPGAPRRARPRRHGQNPARPMAGARKR